MKKILFAAAVLLSALWGCSKDDSGNEGRINYTRIDLTDPIPAEGADYYIPVSSSSTFWFRSTIGGERGDIQTGPDALTTHDGQSCILFKVPANTSYDERSVSMAVSPDQSSWYQVFSGKQSGASASSDIAGITDASATAAAKKVYAKLKELYGHATLTGLMEGDTYQSNANGEALYTKTGAHPAIEGYDLIFLQYDPTPSSWSWTINYSNIEPAKEQWNAGGLVHYMWHWNVPRTKEDWEKAKNYRSNGYDFGGYAFYSESTDFSIAQALTEGTWQNDFIMEDLGKAAAILKLLQDAGIAVIWRPLHEAAGNYNLYGKKNNAWFWWGTGGPDLCKQLWKLMRTTFEKEYGLHNLIWVWTLDVTQGCEDEYSDWYPGDDWVDIIGVDIYEDNTGAKTNQYKAALQLGGGRKMVTISECGNIPDPDKGAAAGQFWSWFTVWEGDFACNTTAYWKQLTSSSYTLTREELAPLW